MNELSLKEMLVEYGVYEEFKEWEEEKEYEEKKRIREWGMFRFE